MKKRWITRMLSLVLVLGLLSAPAFAAESSNCPSCGALYDNGFCTGCGGYQAPELVDGVYQIANAGQLYWFAALVNDGVDGMEKNIEANAVLTADISVNTGDVTNCGGVKQDGWMDWTPIAYGNSRKYSGTFDGQGHTVSGLYCKTTMNFAGLFGNVYDGSVCNVGVVNSYIQGGTFVGGVCGRIYNSGSDTVLTISNCYNTGTVKGTTDGVGGVFGYVQNAGSAAVITVTNCRNSGNVYLTGTSTSGNAGGVCGFLNNTGASAAVTMTKCYNTGSVNAAGSSSKRIGGVCGRCDKATISNCYNTGAVAANGTRSTDVGGVCGYLYATSTAAAKVINCYSIGTPGTPYNSNSNLGGVCGYASAANCTVDNCYFLDTTAGKGIGSGSGTTASKTEAQFASGEVAYLLNGGSSGETNENPLIWHQNIDLGTPDAYPKFSGGTAYKTAAESPCQGYTNNSEGIKQHKFADGVCTWCGAQGDFSTVTVTGTATSFNSDTDEVIIQLIESGAPEAAYETIVHGNSANYSIVGVAPGTYTMKVMKQNHVTREYTVTVSAENVTQDVKIHLLGDVNGNGRIQSNDLSIVYSHVSGTALITDSYILACADVNGNGRIQSNDISRILGHVSGIDPLW